MGRGIAFSDCGITAGLVRQRSGFPAVTPKGERLRDALTSHEAECGRFAGFRAFEAWKHRQAQRDRANKRWGNAGNGSSGNAAAMQGTGTVKGTVKEKPPNPPLPDDVQAILEATGWTHPPSDMALRKQWYEAGADLQQDVVPVLKRETEKLRMKGQPPRFLKVFDAAVREKLATDEREIANLRRISRRYEEADRAAGGAG